MALGERRGLAAVVAAAGRPWPGQARPGARLADYLEAPANADGDASYVERAPGTDANDVLARGRAAMSARRQCGFSLVELAVVLVIIGLLLRGGIAALDAGMEQARRAEQRRQLEHVRSALYGFAMSRGRLPCADREPRDGREDYRRGRCEAGAGHGALPWVTLGVGRRDAWGHPLYYSVAANPGGNLEDFADAPAAPGASSFGLADAGNRDVANGAGELLAEDVPAVVVSFGPQGGQLWTAGGFQCPAGAGLSADERENCDGDQTFVDAGYRVAGDAAGRFDDMLTWVPGAVLKARMVDAGRLP
ncbi:MAG: prepilin-type N-terminal cleavage/methylation domain-containing protein [Halofilum sp. (in: g-proteobacteria)]|nr:prepilin-type N-terminal cleavage/methylation domain-containing protein [Halofilum sp. (in: g-proteobacteria)]